ncbi:hypothetical protein LTR27_005674 [Elasticomyces elasticus]|nr:hypothetical protein LTR27_005674 [Elasticomyces elasticus]
MAPATSSTTPRHVSADPKKGLWSLEYLTLLHLLYTRFAFADPKKRSQHVIAIFQNKAGRGGKFKEVEADPQTPEQQARVERVMPLIRKAITDLDSQDAVNEARGPVAEEDEDGEEADGAGEEADGAGEEADEDEDGNDGEAGVREGEQAEADDGYVEGQSLRDPRLPRGTKRKQSPSFAEPESASKRNRPSSSGFASVVGTAAIERSERAEDAGGEDGQAPTNDRIEGRTAARSSNRRTTQSSRLQAAIANGGSEVIGTETNAAAAVASSNVSINPSSQVEQTSRRKASRVTSSWNGPVNMHKKGKRTSAQNIGTEEHPITVEEEKSALELMSADKTPSLLKHMQKAKLNGSLGKSSNAAGLSDFLYKIDNPLATQTDAVADWEKTQLSIFNQWAQEDGAKTSRLVERGRVNIREDGTLSGYHDSMPQLDRTSSDPLVAIPRQQSQQPHLAAGTMARNGRSLFQSFRDRHDSAISLSSTPYAASSPAGIDVPKTFAQPSTSPSHSSQHARPDNALLLRAFYGPKPRTSAIATSHDRTGRGVQSKGKAAFDTGADLATSPHQSGERIESAQSLHEESGEVVDLIDSAEAGEAFARKNDLVRRSQR